MSDLTDVALTQLADAIASQYDGGTIEIGDDNTAFSSGQTALVASTTYVETLTSVTASGADVIFVTEYDAANGNVEWLELGIFDPSGNMLCRKVLDSIGTKPASQRWGVEATLTLSHPA